MFDEFNEQNNNFQEAEVVEETAGTYEWHRDDYENGFDGHTVYGTARPLYKERLAAPRKRSNFMRYTAAVVAGMFAGAIIFAAAAAYVANGNTGAPPSAVTQTPAPSTAQNVSIFTTELSVVDVAKKAGPSVVGVVSTMQMQSFFGSGVQEQEGGGSGIIIKSDGYIITNSHVIEGANSVKVVLNTGKEYPAKLIGQDKKTDLAVIKIEETDLPVAELGESAALEVGELAVAIGNPLGQEFAGSVTVGVISALNRTMNVEGRQYTLIQTDAAINPGNSGGALVNKYGQIVGINTVKIGASGYEGMGFSIPIDTAMPIINELLENGYVKGRPMIGVVPREITPQMSRRYNLPEGLYVLEVSPFSGAERGGVRVADVIIKADGQEVHTIDQLNKVRDNHKAGDTMNLTIVREGGVVEVSIVLGEEVPE